MVFYHQANIWQKLMIQFQENTRTEERTEGSTDGMTEANAQPTFIVLIKQFITREFGKIV